MLLEAIEHVRERHGDVRTLWGRLFGQEKNLTTSAIARMNLYLQHSTLRGVGSRSTRPGVAAP